MIAIIALLIFIAGLVGFLVGFGTSTLLIPFLVFWYPVHTVLILVGLLHLLGDINKILFLFKSVPWRLIFIFSIPTILMSFLGAELTFFINRLLFLRLLGIMLLIYVLIQWFHKKIVLPSNNMVTLIGGGIYGFFQGLTGIGGVLRATILNSYNLSPAVFIAANGFIALLVDVVRVSTYVSHGLPTEFSFVEYLLFFVATLLSVFVGRYLIHKISVEWLRQLVLMAIFIVSLKFIIYP